MIKKQTKFDWFVSTPKTFRKTSSPSDLPLSSTWHQTRPAHTDADVIGRVKVEVLLNPQFKPLS